MLDCSSILKVFAGAEIVPDSIAPFQIPQITTPCNAFEAEVRQDFRNTDYAFIDTTGRVVFTPKYKPYGVEFHEGLIPTRTAPNKGGFYTRTGELILESPCSTLNDFSAGLAYVEQWGPEEQTGFIDTRGNVVIDRADYGADAEFARWFFEGLVSVKVGNRWGSIDRSGSIIIEPIFGSCIVFKEGLAAVQVGEKMGYIDKRGRVVIEPAFQEAFGFEDGCAFVTREDGFLCVIDRAGKEPINLRPCDFDDYAESMAPFSEGLARVLLEQRTCFIDTKGIVVFRPAFDQIGYFFHEGFNTYSHGGMWGYVDNKGNVAVPAQFDHARPFNNGLAAVKVGGMCGYIDKKGKWVIEPRFVCAHDFREGMALVKLPAKA